MGRSSDSALDDAVEIGLARPDIGFIFATISALIGSGFYWIWPRAALGFGVLFAYLLWAIAAAAFAGSIGGLFVKAKRQKRLNATKAIEDVHALSWSQFEQLIADAFRRQGYRVEEVGGPGDGGIDLVLHSPNGRVVPVQCKRWKKWTVEPKDIREFMGALADMPYSKQGIYVTCGHYTSAAKELAQRNHIELIDGQKLLDMLPSYVSTEPLLREHRSASPPRCPNCGAAMVERTAKKGPNAGNAFWGCSSYPKCKGTASIN